MRNMPTFGCIQRCFFCQFDWPVPRKVRHSGQTSARETPSVQSTMAFLYDAFLSDGETSLSWLYVGTRDFFLKVGDPRVCPPPPGRALSPWRGVSAIFGAQRRKKFGPQNLTPKSGSPQAPPRPPQEVGGWVRTPVPRVLTDLWWGRSSTPSSASSSCPTTRRGCGTGARPGSWPPPPVRQPHWLRTQAWRPGPGAASAQAGFGQKTIYGRGVFQSIYFFVGQDSSVLFHCKVV